MAKQLGTFIVGGKIGDMSFYMSKYGPIARKIGVITKEQYKNDPAFAPRRAAANEFGDAAKLSKLIRDGVERCCPSAATSTTHNNLTRVLRKAISEDTVHEPGERWITADSIQLLEGFNWRDKSTVHTVLHVPYRVELDASAGTASLSFSRFEPATAVKLGEGATHVQLTLALIAADWKTKKDYVAFDKTAMIALSGKSTMRIDLSCALGDYGGNILIAGIGVKGFQKVNGEMVPLLEGVGFEIGAVGVTA